MRKQRKTDKNRQKQRKNKEGTEIITPPEATWLLRGGGIFDGVHEERREGLDILVVNGIITEIGPGLKAKNARIIKLGGRMVLPGLIDAHYHALASSFDLGTVERSSPYLLGQHARHHLENSLRRGFTSIRDAGGAEYGLAEAIESGLIQGPRLFYSGKALTQTGGHGDFRGRADDHPRLCMCGGGGHSFATIADGISEVRRAAREELRKGAAQIKIMASGGVASPADPIWNLQYSEEEIAAAVWEATSWRTYVMAHAYTPEAITRCVNNGVRSIEHANLIDAKTAELCAAKKVFVVPTLVTYEALVQVGRKYGLPPSSVDKVGEVSGAGLEALDHLVKAGVRIGFGTDLLGEAHGWQNREFSIRARVQKPVDVLRSATSINADLLGMQGRIGVIAEGAYADLIVSDGNPLHDLTPLAEKGQGIRMVMRNGEIIRSDL